MFGTQEPDALFCGREIHKIGPKKYRIVDGGFHDLRAADAALGDVSGVGDAEPRRLRAAEELGLPGQGRAADVPAGSSTTRSRKTIARPASSSDLRHVDVAGQSLSNAFFWAISRSQDATFVHDWFTKAGQQMGGEYRYVLAADRRGTRGCRCLDEKATARRPTDDDQLAAQLSGHWRDDAGARRRSARARTPTTSRTSRPAAIPAGRLSRDAEHAELRRQHHRQLARIRPQRHARPDRRLLSRRHVTTYGGLPRVNFSRGERRVGSSVYFGASGEYVTILRSRFDDETTIRIRG